MASVKAVSTPERWAVLDAEGIPIASATRFLRYLDSVERSPNTVRGYAHDLAHFFTFVEREDLRWKTLSNETLGKFVRSMRTPQPDPRDPSRSVRRSEATVNRALCAVASYARFQNESTGDDVYLRLLRPGRRPAWLSEDSPTDTQVAGPRLRTRQQEPRVLSQAERRAIIGSCRSLRDEFLLTLLDQTGMRVGQALQLRHSDIKVPDSVVVVQKRDDEGDGPRNKSWRTAAVPVDRTVIGPYPRFVDTVVDYAAAGRIAADVVS